MKIAVTGKGGVGKTTVAAALARLFAREGRAVIAIDADPDANLASALGVDPEAAARIEPIAHMKQLVAERTGAAPGSMGGIFKLNPRVDDLPESLSLEHAGVRLLVLGTIEKGGSGCICPESTLLKSLLKHVVVRREEVVVMDMEAGIEHLGRGTSAAMDAMLVVVEPGQRSVQTALAIRRLAGDLKVRRVYVVLNKVQGPAEEGALRERLGDLPVIGTVSARESVRRADLEGRSPFDADEDFVAEVAAIAERLASEVMGAR